jgi:hypothetical protein
MEFQKLDREQLKLWFNKVVFPICFPDGDNYWGKQFTLPRGTEDISPWQANTAPNLIFAFTADPESLKKEQDGRILGGNLIPIAQVPEPFFFWDAILSAFLCFAPEIYPDTPTLVKGIHDQMERMGYAPQQYLNFEGKLQFLDRLRAAEIELRFAREPLQMTIQMASLIWFKQLPGGFSFHPLPKRLPIKVLAQIPMEGRLKAQRDWMKERKEKDLANRKNQEFLEKTVESIASEWENLFGKINVN